MKSKSRRNGGAYRRKKVVSNLNRQKDKEESTLNASFVFGYEVPKLKLAFKNK